jgi:hypothetical protein
MKTRISQIFDTLLFLAVISPFVIIAIALGVIGNIAGMLIGAK